LFVRATADNPQGTCYYPRGEIAAGYHACINQYISQCCPDGYTCFSSSLCIITDSHGANATTPVGTTIRAACTDPEWNGVACPNFCLSPADSLGQMNRCSNENEYCCAADETSGSCNCSNGTGIVSISPGLVQSVIGITGTPVTTFPAFTTASSTSNTRSTSSTSSAKSSSSPTSKPQVTAVNTTGFKAGISVAAVVVVSALLYGGYKVWDRYAYHRDQMRQRNRADAFANGNGLENGHVNGNGNAIDSGNGQYLSMNNLSPSRIQSPAPINPQNSYEVAAPQGPSRTTTPANMIRSFESFQDVNPSTTSGFTGRPRTADPPYYGHVPIPNRPGI